MRKLLLIALLAGTAGAPALAQDERGEDRRAQRAEARDDNRSERRQERAERRASRSSDSSDSESSAPPPPPRRSSEAPAQRSAEAPPPSIDAPRARRDAGDTVRSWRARERYRPDSPSAVEERNTAPVLSDVPEPVAERAPRRSIEERNLRRAPRSDADRGLDRPVRTTPGITDRRLGRIGRNVPVEGTAPPPPDRVAQERGRTSRHWSGNWRGDRRYDWRRHRDRNRARFHLGFYFDPFGWSYRRYHVGWRLWPSYYSQDYWLSDPWWYRLPPAYGPYRWIRYHDDALLVNIYTGEVVDVLYDFFW